MTPLHVALAGSSGFLGTHLRQELERRGHGVTALVRREARGPQESSWDPTTGVIDPDVIGAADVVVNLAGSPLLGNPHSRRWARELEESRVSTTRLLAETVAAVATPPAFLAGNGISWYGDHGDADLTEEADTRGHALLTRVTRAWEAAARPAVAAGARVCVLRTAPVMDRRSPPLSQLRLLFRAGLGGRLGSGEQYMPMISLRDWVGAVAFLAEHSIAAGRFNLSTEHAPTNREFTQDLAAQLHRPAIAAVPSVVLRTAAGPMAPELLGSVRAVPAALLEAGYRFADPDVTSVLASGLAGLDADSAPPS